ncbi:MAG: hypothetical protein GY906_34005 [bacterium]|nr:hypothetical protein [bacterium]
MGRRDVRQIVIGELQANDVEYTQARNHLRIIEHELDECPLEEVVDVVYAIHAQILEGGNAREAPVENLPFA